MRIYAVSLFTLSLMTSSFSLAGTVFLFGGGPRPKDALEKFVEKSKAQILVITWATEEPAEVFDAIEADLNHAGATKVVPAAHVINTKSGREKFLQALDRSAGVFFSGGDQNRALDVIDSQNLRPALQAAFQNGKIFAGTSAGTALMPKDAMKGGDAHTLPELRQGLGLVSYFVDQHFIVRDREPRLRKLIEKYRKTGVGVDEGMCALVEDKTLTAMGPTEVQVFIPKANGRIEKLGLKNSEQITIR